MPIIRRAGRVAFIAIAAAAAIAIAACGGTDPEGGGDGGGGTDPDASGAGPDASIPGPDATTTVCGDQLLVFPEECDDGNTTTGDGCDDMCRLETSPNCGDSIVDYALG